MLPILWRAEAQADLAAILEYIAERNPQSAFDLYDGIERVVSQLPHHPYLYHLGRGIWHARTRRSPQLHCRISRWRFRNRNSLSRAFAAVVSLTAALRTAMSGRSLVEARSNTIKLSPSRQGRARPTRPQVFGIGSGVASLPLLRERAHRYRRLRQYVLLQALLIRWSQVRIPHGLPRIRSSQIKELRVIVIPFFVSEPVRSSAPCAVFASCSRAPTTAVLRHLRRSQVRMATIQTVIHTTTPLVAKGQLYMD
jgi:plasmid stabilization system protein ParE